MSNTLQARKILASESQEDDRSLDDIAKSVIILGELEASQIQARAPLEEC